MSQTMKLSEAIRLGAMLKPQAFDNYEVDGGTCALGAAIEARSMSIDSVAREGLIGAFPDWDIILCRMCCCPVNLCFSFPSIPTQRRLEGMVVHLNDQHRWTREQISDWVQTIEDQLEQSSSEAKAEQTEEQYA